MEKLDFFIIFAVVYADGKEILWRDAEHIFFALVEVGQGSEILCLTVSACFAAGIFS